MNHIMLMLLIVLNISHLALVTQNKVGGRVGRWKNLHRNRMAHSFDLVVTPRCSTISLYLFQRLLMEQRKSKRHADKADQAARSPPRLYHIRTIVDDLFTSPSSRIRFSPSALPFPALPLRTRPDLLRPLTSRTLMQQRLKNSGATMRRAPSLVWCRLRELLKTTSCRPSPAPTPCPTRRAKTKPSRSSFKLSRTRSRMDGRNSASYKALMRPYPLFGDCSNPQFRQPH